MKKIVMHWTAGAQKPCAVDLQHYHYLFDTAGKRYDGVFRPEDNLNCADGRYAQHCGSGNTGAIGVACCGMKGMSAGAAREIWVNPLTRVQVEAMCKWIAVLCKRYGIVVSPASVYTHAEFGLANPKTSSAGKIDISYLPFAPEVSAGGGASGGGNSTAVKARRVGDWLRTKVKWYLERV